MDTLEFLDLIWGERKCYVDLPSKANGHWIPANIAWPSGRGMVRRRVDSCLEDDEDLYFSVAQFRSKGRRIADVLATHWLWADLDRVDPVFLDEENVLPTLAWESSPGRYQCLWRLRYSLQPEQQTKLNRALSLSIGADRGGWDLTQVLRPIGTKNYKYGMAGKDVSLLWYDPTTVYEPVKLLRSVRAIEPEDGHVTAQAHVKAAASAVDLASYKLPARARRLLGTPPENVVVGERSDRLWELECLLLESGLSIGQVFELVEPSAWNKHKEVGRSDERLRNEITRAAEKVAKKKARPEPLPIDVGHEKVQEAEEEEDVGEEPQRPRVSPFVEYANFLSATIETPRWLIQDIWSSASHGIIGGEPKTSKSTYAMAMALSVASGRPFLGKYEVSSPGPVVMIQEENAPWVVQDRLRKIAYSYGLIRPSQIEVTEGRSGSIAKQTIRLDFPDEAPLYMLNNYGFDLDDEEDRDLLIEQIREVGAAMVILDPLYLMVGDKNINHAHEVTPLMQWLMALRYNHNCAVVLVHHWSKSGAGTANEGRRPGQRLMGSGLLHGWVESAAYMEALEPVVDRAGTHLMVKVSREFRNVSPRSDLEIGWLMGEPGEMKLDVSVVEVTAELRKASLVDIVDEAGAKGITLKDVMGQLGMTSKTAAYKMAVSAGCEVIERSYGGGVGYMLYPAGIRNGEGLPVQPQQSQTPSSPKGQ